MKKIVLKKMRLENYKSFSGYLTGRRSFSCEFGNRTRILGRNREGKTTIKDAYFDILTSKMADGTQPEGKVRPHTKDGSDIDRIDVIREIEFEIDGNPVIVEKKTSQKWRKPHGQSDEVYDGNLTTYSIDGFEAKQKEFKKWQESIVDPEILLMCSNPKPFLNMVQKSTAEARKLLERISGFDMNSFISKNPEYSDIDKITKGHSIEDTLKQLRKNLSVQKKSVETVRTQLEYEKQRDISGDIEISDLELSINNLNSQIEDLEQRELELNEKTKTFDESSKNILDMKFKQSDIARRKNASIVSQKKEIEDQILSLEQEKRNIENKLRISEMDLRNLKMAMERTSVELKKAQEDWKSSSEIEYPEEIMEGIRSESFDENSWICPTCGQHFTEEKSEKIRQQFEEKKKKRLEEENKVKNAFYKEKDRKLTEIAERGSKASADIKEYKNKMEELERTINDYKKNISDLYMEIQISEKKITEIPEVDLSKDSEYQAITSEIKEAEEALNHMNNGSSERTFLMEKRNELLNEMSDQKSTLKKRIFDEEEKERRVEELGEKLKNENQKVAYIERDIDKLKKFSIKKNEELASIINKHFIHFKFNFLDFTQEGNPVETLQILVDGTDYFSGLNGGDQRLAEIDLCKGLQEINGLCMPIWLDEANTVDPERIPKDLEQQLISLERADCKLAVEVDG